MYASWLAGGNTTIDTTLRAVDAWRLIQENPTSIVIRRAVGSDLTAQTVRIEYEIWERRVDTNTGQSSYNRLTVFGVRGHPTVDDTDIEERDRFVLDNREFQVISVSMMPGAIQALCEVRA